MVSHHCFCNVYSCKGKLVSRKTFYRHKKKDDMNIPSPTIPIAAAICYCEICNGKTVSRSKFFRHKKNLPPTIPAAIIANVSATPIPVTPVSTPVLIPQASATSISDATPPDPGTSNSTNDNAVINTVSVSTSIKRFCDCNNCLQYEGI
jgi:hypothetical protein